MPLLRLNAHSPHDYEFHDFYYRNADYIALILYLCDHVEMAYGYSQLFSVLILSHQNFCATQLWFHDQTIVVQIRHRSRAHDNMEFLCVQHVGQDLNVCHTLRIANIPDASRIQAIVFVRLHSNNKKSNNKVKI